MTRYSEEEIDHWTTVWMTGERHPDFMELWHYTLSPLRGLVYERVLTPKDPVIAEIAIERKWG